MLAVITHWMHNAGKASASPYGEKCRKYLQTILCASDPSLDKKDITLKSIKEQGLFQDAVNVPFPSPERSRFTFIDLFAGMGGFRLAMQKHGGRCVFSSEWNAYAQKTYFANFGEVPFGDITDERIKAYIPDNFDVLCAGFPCQPFSIAGISKKNSLGRAHGFLDKTQGTLFFDVAEIIRRKRPKAFYLENVKNLQSHDKGRTFHVISNTLQELGYNIHYQIMDGKYYVPQHRERIMIIGFRNDLYQGKETFTFPAKEDPHLKIRNILDPNIDAKYTLTDKLWLYLQNYAKKHQANGNGFGYGLTNLDGISRTLSARYYKDGSEILIPQGEGKNPRRLSPRECARLMGYSDQYIINAVSEVQAYHQCGNSVIVPLITAVAGNLVKSMLNDECK
ncbi:MAG: DNA (cytosine-5-)-methyltransferase [Alistipes sp.]|nr:DNA (cytosine-5-)-methyltransferase [Alistipes sp.]